MSEKLSDKAGEAGAEGLAASAKRLWGLVRERLDGDEEKKVVDLFETSPELGGEALSKVLERRLDEDPAFAAQVREIVEAEAPGGGSRWQVMGEYVGIVDAHGAHFGDGATLSGLNMSTPRARDDQED